MGLWRNLPPSVTAAPCSHGSIRACSWSIAIFSQEIPGRAYIGQVGQVHAAGIPLRSLWTADAELHFTKWTSGPHDSCWANRRHRCGLRPVFRGKTTTTARPRLVIFQTMCLRGQTFVSPSPKMAVQTEL